MRASHARASSGVACAAGQQRRRHRRQGDGRPRRIASRRLGRLVGDPRDARILREHAGPDVAPADRCRKLAVRDQVAREPLALRGRRARAVGRQRRPDSAGAVESTSATASRAAANSGWSTGRSSSTAANAAPAATADAAAGLSQRRRAARMRAPHSAARPRRHRARPGPASRTRGWPCDRPGARRVSPIST